MIAVIRLVASIHLSESNQSPALANHDLPGECPSARSPCAFECSPRALLLTFGRAPNHRLFKFSAATGRKVLMRSRGIAMKVVQIVVLSGTRARRKREG